MSTDDKEAPERSCISATGTTYLSLPLTHNIHTVFAYAVVLPSDSVTRESAVLKAVQLLKAHFL